MWREVVFLVALAGASALADDPLTFPELARGRANTRIVSGWEAKEGQLPHQLSLRMVAAQGQVFSCGASIIHNEWALTAAHCTAQRVTIIIRAGTVNMTRPGTIFETTEYMNHPLYDESQPSRVQPNDVGLIKFNRRLEFNERIQPIRIQRSVDKDNDYDGDRMTASGWGRVWTNGAAPENLNWVFLRGVTNFFCWWSFGGSSIIQPSTICASGYNDTTQSTCQGDSGGPLTVIDADGKPTLVGVTSFVSAMGCHADLPAGFCRGGYYHDWYQEVTGINFDWDFDEPTEKPEEPESPEEPEGTEDPEETHPTEGPGEATPNFAY
ncbi:hypothetical protein evm_007419 [Chilo suppressalis]|nr:hypothetical protein evm_007419 [Chilo suppressalis]